jgi:hypothetical protein
MFSSIDVHSRKSGTRGTYLEQSTIALGLLALSKHINGKGTYLMYVHGEGSETGTST